MKTGVGATFGIVACLFIAAAGRGEGTVSKEVLKIVQKLEAQDRIVVYEGGEYWVPEYRKLIDKLQSIATVEELQVLSHHTNPVVRFEACRALTRLGTTNILALAVSHLDDTQLVRSQYGCTGRREAFADALIGWVSNPNLGVDNTPDRGLSEIEQRKLDSLVLYSKNALDARYHALERVGANPAHYRRIREMAVADQYGPALVALARFRNEADTQIISNFESVTSTGIPWKDKPSYYRLLAIQEFPHPSFFPQLEARQRQAMDSPGQSGVSREEFQTVASYRNEEAGQLLALACARPLDELRHSNAERVYEAMRMFMCPEYDSLLFEIWDKHQIITADVFAHLTTVDSARALKLAEVSIRHALNLYYSNAHHPEFDATVDVLSAMLAYSIARDRNQTIQTIAQNLSTANVFIFPPFARLARQEQDTSFLRPLLNRMRFDGNPHIYLKAAETLLSYGDSVIDQRLLTAIKVNDSVKAGWGRDSLKILLRKSGLR